MKTWHKLLVFLALYAGYSWYMPRSNGEDTPEKTLEGIVANMQRNMRACTEEDIYGLLECMSAEMPNRAAFISVMRRTWAEEDAYHRLDDVKLLEHSDAPHARTDFPYAVAVVTQTVLKTKQEGVDSVFRSSCKDGKCDLDKELAHRMSLSPKFETFRLQMLFKKEKGEWKCVAGLTDPEPVDTKKQAEKMPEMEDSGEIAEERPRQRPRGRSVFN